MRVLATTITNPLYNPELRHGVKSIRMFYASLPVFFEYRDSRSMANSSGVVCVDIPALGLQGITDPALLLALYNATAAESGQKLPQLPEGETAIACGVCKNPTWYLTRDKFHQAASSVCVKCGNIVKIVRSFHQAGHA
jgi:hypothetical protein